MFEDRQEVGRKLAERLAEYKNSQDSVVLSIPRGGVVVGAEIARDLNLPLEAVAVKKLGAPANPELAIGSVAQNGAKYIDWELVVRMGIGSEYLASEVEDKRKEVEERVKNYQIVPDKLLRFSNFILTDDGIATGATIKAALNIIKSLIFSGKRKAKIILAVPVLSKEIFNELQKESVRMEVIEVSDNFGSVGQFFASFPQIKDREVIELLNKYRR